MAIHTSAALGQYVVDLVDRQKSLYPGTLEEYLRSLLGLLDQHRDDAPSWALFGKLFEESFQAAPLDFDIRWLWVEKMPQREIETAATDAELFGYLRELLVFQIADLRRIFVDYVPSPHGPADHWFGAGTQSQTPEHNQFWPDFLIQGVS